jgi:hypothetical protein
MTDEQAHRFSREHGVNRALYEFVRVVLLPLVKVWYRFRVTGAEHIPKDGPVIIAPNHKSFYDSFFLGLASRRPPHFMAKTELFAAGPPAFSTGSARSPSSAARLTPKRSRRRASCSSAAACSRCSRGARAIAIRSR